MRIEIFQNLCPYHLNGFLGERTVVGRRPFFGRKTFTQLPEHFNFVYKIDVKWGASFRDFHFVSTVRLTFFVSNNYSVGRVEMSIRYQTMRQLHLHQEILL